MNLDTALSAVLSTVRVMAQDMGFIDAPNRSDGMMVGKVGSSWEDWSLETRFTHGEARVILTHGRKPGGRRFDHQFEHRITGPITLVEIRHMFEMSREATV